MNQTSEPNALALLQTLSEVRERAINIERKIDKLSSVGRESDPSRPYAGHRDQVFGPSTYAQHGDDLVAINIFHNIGITHPSYLDIGAHHPLNISNTALLYRLGSRGINVEPNPNLMAPFLELRPEDCNVNVGVSSEPGVLTFYMIDECSGRNTFDQATAEAFVAGNPQFSIREKRPIEVLTLNQIIDRYANGTFPDFLTLDVEGLDLAVLGSIDYAKTKPKVICVEYISGDNADKHEDIKRVLRPQGFFCAFKTIGNAFYVANEYRSRL
jgi:FkbM family methyltransferase